MVILRQMRKVFWEFAMTSDSCLMRYPSGSFSGWRLWLTAPLQVGELSRQTLPDGITWTDWRERKGELFQAQRMEKNIMGLI